MNTNTTTPVIDNSFAQNGGHIWSRLHSEREDVCAALLGGARPVNDTLMGLQETEPSEENSRELEWKRRELLQARLRQIDDALDRLFSGAYGHCSDCGKRITQKRLAADPAVSCCLPCQQRDEGERAQATHHKWHSVRI
jgi:RNA polymerase-binding transcription factor DksA